ALLDRRREAEGDPYLLLVLVGRGVGGLGLGLRLGSRRGWRGDDELRLTAGEVEVDRTRRQVGADLGAGLGEGLDQGEADRGLQGVGQSGRDLLAVLIGEGGGLVD